jgi:hypothetical protein
MPQTAPINVDRTPDRKAFGGRPFISLPLINTFRLSSWEHEMWPGER